MTTRQVASTTCGALLAAIWLVAAPATAQDGTASPASPAAVPTTITITCSSKPGERQHCPADTSHGVVLARSAGAIALHARQDVGVRRPGRLGVGRMRRRLRGRPGDRGDDGEARAEEETPGLHPQRGVPDRRGREGRDVRPALHLRPVPEPEGPGFELHRLLRPHHRREAAAGRPAQQVLPGLPRLVPDPEVPLLPLRLEREHLAGRARPGGGRRVPELHVQPVRDPGWRHQRPSQRAQHRGPVPLLARDRQPADRGRVLPRLVHHRASGSRASSPRSSSTWP